jgi:CheY-like chemotaxis protein
MSRLLQQRLGYQVFVASTVKDALDVAEREQGKFDLVISDIGLPDGTGLQLMKVLRENYRLKGIALSGYGMEEDVKRSKTAGFEVHLTKPVNFSSLTAAIHRVIPPFTPPSSPTIAPTNNTSSSQSSPASPRRTAYLSSATSSSSSTPSPAPPAAPPSSPRLDHRVKPGHADE